MYKIKFPIFQIQCFIILPFAQTKNLPSLSYFTSSISENTVFFYLANTSRIWLLSTYATSLITLSLAIITPIIVSSPLTPRPLSTLGALHSLSKARMMLSNQSRIMAPFCSNSSRGSPFHQWCMVLYDLVISYHIPLRITLL